MIRTRRPPVRSLADIAAEAVLIAGGARAILLQIADPAIGHAVADHSDFVRDPLARLRHTLVYLYALTFGTAEQTAAVRAMVDGAHAPVRSGPDAPQQYDARDAHRQLWVTATLFDSSIDLWQRIHGPLSTSALDRIYSDYVIVGTALQMPAELWPADRAAFDAYWSRSLACLQVDDTIRRVADDLLYSRAPLLRPVLPLARLITAGLLPPLVREQFRMHWSPARERRFDVALRVIAVIDRILPARVRHWPKNRLLRDLDRHLRTRAGAGAAES